MIPFFRTIGLFMPLAIAMTVDHITRHESNRVQVTHLKLPLPNLPPAFDGYTIAHISDMHIGHQAWVDIPRMQLYGNHAMAVKPDLIAITGDFADLDINPQTQRTLVEMLRPICAPDGVFGVTGNHDFDDDVDLVRRAVQRGGVTLLDNCHQVIQRGEQKLVIAGVDSARSGNPDLRAALEGVPKDACVILLAHEPDYADMVRWEHRVKLQLSGHTHGGQLILPFFGPPYLPSWGEKYIRGLYQLDGLKLYVNSGLGMRYPPLRRKAIAEITHITLQCAT